ncbi:MAG: hypothetical protein CM1200mP39_10830 [Dehalococcoidia bacterium]|nr:MAG: hypothetical protein CM1200mP39_10830 [Dehalococcoidia bacterium]
MSQRLRKKYSDREGCRSGEISVGFVNHYYLHRFIAEEGESFAARNYYTRLPTLVLLF